MSVYFPRPRVTVLLCSVTAPVLVSSTPLLTAPVLTVIDASARMIPLKIELTPSVADVPTDQ